MKNILKKATVPVGVVGIILLLIVPVPAMLLDLLIITNLLFALVILLTTMFIRKPLDFSVFPSLLLVATLFRLGLNLASTKLILGEAHAGAVISAFGEIVVGGSLIIGIVVFLILVVIQFVVVTKGAERVAEVGARFTLDAMPGKQMAIDADLNAGIITDMEARKRRSDVAAEADFYGAMDGASKFVKGDAIAGLVIIVINIIAGIALGMTQHGMEVGEAVQTFSLLTVGDGLVTQIPALLMAIATGMVVTRSNAEEEMGESAATQLSQSSIALLIAGGAAVAMGFIPGMPILAFFAVGAILIFAGLRSRKHAAEVAALELSEVPAAPAGPNPDDPEQILAQAKVSALEIVLSPDVVDVAQSGGDLLPRMKALRREIAMQFGFVVPRVRTHDSSALPQATYCIKVAGAEVGRGLIPRGAVLAIGDGLDALPGPQTVDPVYGMPGKWIPVDMQHAAEMAGATVMSRSVVVVTHLSHAIKSNAARLLSSDAVREMNEELKKSSPSAVEELTPSLLSLPEVQSVLQGLLAERVPINDLARIYEALALQAKKSNDLDGLIEAARGALGAAIPARLVENGRLRLVMFDPTVEALLLQGLRPSDQGMNIILEPDQLDAIHASTKAVLENATQMGDAALVCAPQLRPAVRRMFAAYADVPVLSYQEASAGNYPIDTVGVITGVLTPSAMEG